MACYFKERLYIWHKLYWVLEFNVKKDAIKQRKLKRAFPPSNKSRQRVLFLFQWHQSTGPIPSHSKKCLWETSLHSLQTEDVRTQLIRIHFSKTNEINKQLNIFPQTRIRTAYVVIWFMSMNWNFLQNKSLCLLLQANEQCVTVSSIS